jgi:short-subunit dehydrogenase
MRMAGSRALVTGASGGIGQAIARELAAQSCEVILTGRRESALQELAAELGPTVLALTADLDSIQGARDLLERAGRVDILVANAGLEAREPLQDLTDDALEQALHVNLLAPLALARQAIPPMLERRGGHIVLISSVAGLVATSGNGPLYTTTKWGLRGLGLALRQDLHGTGVSASTIFPGPIRDAGMFADTGVPLPAGAGSNSPGEVAAAVTRAIERDLPEVVVAKGAVRLGAALGRVAPIMVGHFARRAGAAEVRQEMIASRLAPDDPELAEPPE